QARRPPLLRPDDYVFKWGSSTEFWLQPVLTRRGLGDAPWDVGRNQRRSPLRRRPNRPLSE
ncbi:MAG TPA: hypothetical protein VFA26_09630, partial [Gemmataceae bacterium]|nr:hypothetical protein [Gemmataceae bacterium]